MNLPPRPEQKDVVLEEIRAMRKSQDASFRTLGAEIHHVKSRVGSLETRVHNVETRVHSGLSDAHQRTSNVGLEAEAAIAGIATAFDSLVRAQARQHNELIDMHRGHGAYLHQIHTKVVPEVFGKWWRRPEVWRGAAYFVAALVGSLIAQGVLK